MTSEEIKTKIYLILNEMFTNVENKHLDLLTKNGLLDSVTILQFICEIEDVFKIEIQDEDLDLNHFSDIHSLCKLISRLIN